MGNPEDWFFHDGAHIIMSHVRRKPALGFGEQEKLPLILQISIFISRINLLEHDFFKPQCQKNEQTY